jgi:23S rRNA pseudouridine1911/1915/1917 synthase
MAFDADAVVVGGSPISPSDRLAEGTMAVVTLVEPRGIEPDATVPFAVVFEDPDIVVIDKPIGVVVHPTSERSTGTLVHGLLARYGDIVGVGAPGRWGIVHRLDRDTSGLLVVARTPRAHEALSVMMRDRSITRTYLALVAGRFDATLGTIDAPIARDPRNPTRMMIERSGRQAITHYRRLAEWEAHDLSLVEVTLETGRTHQIRVHMQAIDHPIVGDPAYGRIGMAADPGRPWLHAHRLEFTHPFEGTSIDIVAPLPDDLADSLVVIGDPDTGELAAIDRTTP